MTLIYKIAPGALWREAEAAGVFVGSSVDLKDGFIHFSGAAQVRQTAARYFAGEADLVLAAIDADKLGTALRWEASRDGALFPHLYAPLDMAAVAWVRPLPLGNVGQHIFPDLG